MAHSDFVFLSIDETLDGAIGDATAVKEFTIDGTPLGHGYILIQTFDVQEAGHRIVINGKDLTGMDFPTHPTGNVWQTWMDRIPAGILKQGKNTLQIHKQAGTDAFRVQGASINWRVEG